MKTIALQGILFDEKSSYLRGPAQAPPLIRQAYHNPSANYYAENGQKVAPEMIQDLGDYQIDHYFDIETISLKNLSKQQPLFTLGGDHSISYPVVKALAAIHGPLDILHLDAHSDLYTHFEGDPYAHACPFYNIMKDGLAKRLVQVGIRTLNDEQQKNAEKYGVEIVSMQDFNAFTMPQFNNPLYLSLDIDVLDPAFAPGVSHLEPGGLTTRQLISLIQSIKTPLIGADLVEYNPTRDLNGMTAMVCAKLFKEVVVKMGV